MYHDEDQRRPVPAPGTTSVALGLVLLLSFALPTFGQERVTLAGTVVDVDTGEALAAAQVLAPLSEVVTLTDSTGAFEISFIEDVQYELVATAIGYHSARATLGPEVVGAAISIQLPRDEEVMQALTVLSERLEERRRWQRTRRLRLVHEVELARSDEESAYEFVRVLAAARPCDNLQELCRLGRSRVRLCIDDTRPSAGARALEALDPADLWLIEMYNEGREVRVYTRWFIDNTLRARQGEIRLNPIC
ncbi:MAG: carboxypeptidase-like regulatory domain-containing protein [Gemmatimonadota bacterium]